MSALHLTASAHRDLDTHCRNQLARVESWDLTAAARRTRRRLGWSKRYSAQVEREYRRFLGLIVMNPDKAYGMAGDVDELWHDHLLDTRDYLAMCRAIVGGVVHHCPSDPSAATDTPSAYEAETYPDLARCYRGRPSAVWPQGSAGDGAVARCCGHAIERQLS